MRSAYGRNIHNICMLAGVTDISLVDMEHIIINPVPPGEEWRDAFLRDLLSERNLLSGFLSESEVWKMIDTVCCD